MTAAARKTTPRAAPKKRASKPRAPASAVAEEGMRAAQQFFSRVLQHNEEPPDEEIEAMVRSWSA